jgi:protein-disulfide isomerase
MAAGAGVLGAVALTGAPATRAAVERDLSDGRAAGVTGTPSFFVNGRRITGAQAFAQIATVIDAALKTHH